MQSNQTVRSSKATTAEEIANGSPCDWPAGVLAEKLRRREITAVHALEAHLERIEERNEALHAVVSLDAKSARKMAKSADDAIAHGKILGPLHGVPMTLKDGHEVAGLRTTVGTKDLDRTAKEDGTVAARLRAAGAVIIGHTNVPPWLSDLQCDNEIFGRTNNPWNVARTSGGSSGGAAAAVATGMTPLEIGSDLTGSVRLPASFCGVYGLKTTEHRVPLTGFVRPPKGGPSPLRIISCLGPIARDLSDLELALSIIAGPDDRDGDVPPVPLVAEPRRDIKDLRLAILTTLAGANVQRTIKDRVDRVSDLAKSAGANVSSQLPDIDWKSQGALLMDLVTTLMAVFNPEADHDDEHQKLAWYLEALSQRDHFVSAWAKYFEDVDALIVPTTLTTAFAHCERGAKIDVDGKQVSYLENGRILGPCNVVGLPALSVPAGFDEAGLPIGLQIIGPRWSEMRLIAIARALEETKITPGFTAPK